MNMNLDVDGNRVIGKFQELYPVHFNHALAEVKSEMLAEQLEALETGSTQEEAK